MGKYESYQETPYTWLPEVPNHWSSKTIRSITKLSNERCCDRQYTLLSVYREYGVIQKASREDNRNVESEDLSNYKVVAPGDLVLNKMKMWQGSLGVSKYQGIVSPAYIVCNVIDSTINSDYLHMLLRSTGFKTYYNQFSYGVRVGQWDMHYDDFKKLVIYLPPSGEQDHIVRYLDWQTSKINQLIIIKKKQIEVLKEKKRAFITEIVMHGMNPLAQFKDTGIKLLGCIPKQWKIARNKYLFKEINDTGYTNLPLLSITNSSGVVLQSETGRKNRMSENVKTYKRIQPGDIGYNLMNAFIGSLGVAQQEGLISPAYAVCRPIVPMCPKYFEYLYKTPIYLQIFDNYSYGIMIERNRLYFENFSKIFSIVPPIEEQEHIVKVVQQYENTIHALISKIQQSIQYLQEFRTRLISDVVTGQIDVRNIEVPDFELVEEPADEAEEPENEGEME